MAARCFVTALLLIMLLSLLGLAVFNAWIDPHRIFNTPFWRDAPRPLTNNQRLVKPHVAWQARCEIILLGTSRGGVFDMGHPGLGIDPGCNLSLAGSAMYDNYRMFQHAQAIRPLRQVIIGLDYFSFSMRSATLPDFEDRLATTPDGDLRPSYYRLREYLIALVSKDFTRASWGVLRYKPSETPVPDTLTVLQKSRLIESGFMLRDGFWLKVGVERYRRQDFAFLEHQLQYFEAMVRDCHENGIDLRLFISPIHARLQTAFHVVGIDAAWAYWKRRLVQINASVAAEYGREPFVLWDFAIINERTTEPVPDAPGTSMTWYIETSHFNMDFANSILDVVLTVEQEPIALAERLQSSNVDAALSRQARVREQWRADNPGIVADLSSLAEGQGVLVPDDAVGL